MSAVFQPILDYAARSILLTVQQLAIVLGPLLILALILDHLARFVRARAARILTLNFYTYLTAPGVMVHELGHAFFCVIFRHRIDKMHLFRPASNGTLGSVQHSFNPRSTYQRIGNFFIGTGPIWFGSALVCLLAWYLLGPAATDVVRDVPTSSSSATLPAMASHIATLALQLFLLLFRPSVTSTWQFWLFAYLMFCIGSHITLSRSDIRGAARGFVSLVLLVLLLNLLTLSLGEQISLNACRRLLQGSVIFCAGMLLVVGLNFSLAVLLFFLSFLIRVAR